LCGGLGSRISEETKKKPAVFFGGTFSGNSFTAFLGNEILNYLIKNKIILKNLNIKAKYFQNELNSFFENKKINVKIYRYASLLRIVFTKKKIVNRIQRDFFENQYSKKIKMFRSYLFKNSIYYPSSGVIFFSASTSNKSIVHLIKFIKKGILKYF
jgi:glutamate-1-semialdehyde aminotransferase